MPTQPVPVATAPVSTTTVLPACQSTAPSVSTPTSRVAPLPTRISRYRLSPQEVPVDFFADPDGQWEFSTLVEMAGFNHEHPGASVGALTQAFDGYPEGAAVITEVGTGCRYVAIALLPSLTPSAGVTSNAGVVPNQTALFVPRSPRAA